MIDCITECLTLDPAGHPTHDKVVASSTYEVVGAGPAALTMVKIGFQLSPARSPRIEFRLSASDVTYPITGFCAYIDQSSSLTSVQAAKFKTLGADGVIDNGTVTLAVHNSSTTPASGFVAFNLDYAPPAGRAETIQFNVSFLDSGLLNVYLYYVPLTH